MTDEHALYSFLHAAAPVLRMVWNAGVGSYTTTPACLIPPGRPCSIIE